MSIIQGAALGGSAYQIANSVRFRSAASAYLSRTFNTPTNSNVFTYSAFIKRGSLGGTFRLLGASTTTYLTFNSSDQINLTLNGVSAATSTAVFRDISAHYHVVYQQNGASQTIWVNNVVVATGTTASAVFNTAIVHQIGAANTANFFDGYVSEINFVDGQALDPNSFGSFDAITGQWIPKKYSGVYGTNGFFLPFNDGTNLTNLCLDHSGNGNNWTASGISLTAGSSYDWMDDTPSNNFAVLNPLDVSASTATMSNANLTATGLVIGGGNAFATIAVPSSGKFYWEITPTNLSGDGMIGIGDISATSSYFWQNTNGSLAYYSATGARYLNNSFTAYGATYAANDVIGVAADIDAGTVTFYKNNISQGVITFNAAGLFPALGDGSGSYASNFNANFGQRPFTYSPPAGFKALCTKNLPTPSILNPKKHFDVVLATGANIKSTAEAVFPSNFLEWIKDRGNANNHQLIDIVRGTSAVLQSNTTAAETTYSAPSGSSVGWLWKAGGAPVTNNAGSIQSQVSANPQAGFSIVTYTGSASTGATIGHGLGVAPKMIIVKRLDSLSDWAVWHTGLTPTTGTLYLDLTSAQTAYPNRFDSTGMTSVVFKTGSQAVPNEVNDSGGTFVAYCFAEIPGFSKIGSYTGNGSADGPFVYCGFRPRFVMVKCSSTAGGGWVIHDSARSPKNIADQRLSANISDAEYGSDGFGIDILSNGFKARTADGNWNSSGQTYIFYAVAEYPFNYSTAR